MNIKSRFAVLSIPAVIVGLCWLFPREQPSPLQCNAVGEQEIPVVAFHGRPVRQYEEPLPDGARVRIGSTRFRHTDDLHRQSGLDAGDVVITEDDGILTLFHTGTGERTFTESLIENQTANGTLSYVFAKRLRKLVTWSVVPDGGTVAKLWDVNTVGKPKLQLGSSLVVNGKLPRVTKDVWFTPDESTIVVEAEFAVIRFDAKSGVQKSIVSTNEHNIIHVSEDGSRTLASLDFSNQFGFWRMGGGFGYGPPRYRFREPELTKVATERRVDPFGDLKQGLQSKPMVENVELVVFDSVDGQQIAKAIIPQYTEDFDRIELSPDGKFIAYRFDESIFVLDVDRMRSVVQVPPPDKWKSSQQQSIGFAWFSADGTQLIVRASDGRKRGFQLPSGREVRAMEEAPSVRRIFGRRHRWDDPYTKEGIIRHQSSRSTTGYAGALMAVSPDGHRIAIGDAEGRVDVWGTNGKFLKKLQSTKVPIGAIAFNVDGTQLAVCDKRRLLRIWDSRSWKEIERIEIPAEHEELFPTRLTFSPDGKRLLLNQGQAMSVMDLASKRMMWDEYGELNSTEQFVPAFSIDGSRIFRWGQEPWVEIETGEPSTELDAVQRDRLHKVYLNANKRHGRIRLLSPDQRLLACTSANGRFEVWDLVRDELLQTFPESATIRAKDSSLRFSPDGRRLLTFNDRGQLHVWEIASGQLACTLNYPNGHFNDARFGVDGRTIITANHREVIVWDLKPTTTIADPWEALGHDAPVAEQARRTLLADPKHAIAYIEKRMKPAPNLVEARIRRSIDALEHKDFCERERATAELIEYGRGVLPRLQDARLASEEGKARLASLVRLLSAGPTANEMRQVRGEEVLEQARLALR